MYDLTLLKIFLVNLERTDFSAILFHSHHLSSPWPNVLYRHLPIPPQELSPQIKFKHLAFQYDFRLHYKIKNDSRELKNFQTLFQMHGNASVEQTSIQEQTVLNLQAFIYTCSSHSPCKQHLPNTDSCYYLEHSALMENLLLPAQT